MRKAKDSRELRALRLFEMRVSRNARSVPMDDEWQRVLRQDTLTATNFFDDTGSTKTVSIRPKQMNIGASVKLDF